MGPLVHLFLHVNDTVNHAFFRRAKDGERIVAAIDDENEMFVGPDGNRGAVRTDSERTFTKQKLPTRNPRVGRRRFHRIVLFLEAPKLLPEVLPLRSQVGPGPLVPSTIGIGKLGDKLVMFSVAVAVTVIVFVERF